MRKFDVFVRRLDLGVVGLVALVGALCALIGSVAVFGAVTEDVTQRNGLSRHDVANLRFFTSHRPDALVHAARVVTDFGTFTMLAILVCAASLALWRYGSRVVVAAAPAISLAIAALAVAITKYAVDRNRPPVALRRVAEGGASFPSGHAADSAAAYVTVALVVAIYVLRRPLARIVVVLAGAVLVGAVGVSRLVLGVHWPTDVIAGWALGGTVGLAVTVTVSLLSRMPPRAVAPSDRRVRRAAVALTCWMTSERKPRDARAT